MGTRVWPDRRLHVLTKAGGPEVEAGRHSSPTVRGGHVPWDVSLPRRRFRQKNSPSFDARTHPHALWTMPVM